MTTEEINDFLVRQIFSTDGKLENQLTDLLMDYDEATRCEIMKRYIYFKAYVVDQITHEITMSASAYDEYCRYLHYLYERYMEEHKEELLRELQDINYNEMSVTLDHFDKTGYKIKDCREIILRDLPDELCDNRKLKSKLTRIMEKTYANIKVSVTAYQNGTSYSGAAYIGIIIIAIICLISAMFFI